MKTITVFKASPVVRDMPVESMRLEISNDIEDMTKSLSTLSEVEHAFMSQADMVMQALNALPQGTRHKLLVMMLQDWQNLYHG